MKILEHGVFCKTSLDIICDKCDCKYQIEKEDVKEYTKLRKIQMCAFDDIYTEKFRYYSVCPECEYDNPLKEWDRDILFTEPKIKSELNVKIEK